MLPVISRRDLSFILLMLCCEPELSAKMSYNLVASELLMFKKEFVVSTRSIKTSPSNLINIIYFNLINKMNGLIINIILYLGIRKRFEILEFWKRNKISI